MRQALLRRLCEGDTRTQACAALEELSLRGLQRYIRKNKEFGTRVVRAMELGKSELVDPRFAEQLIGGEVPPYGDGPEPPDYDPIDALEEIPDPVVVGEVVDRAPPDPLDPSDPFHGLPPFTERALLALSWRIVHNAATPATVHSTHTQCLYKHFAGRTRRATLMQLGSIQAARSAGPTERGLTREAILWFRRAVIGPSPDEQDSEDEDEDEDVG